MTIRIYSLEDAKGLEAAMERTGIPAQVNWLPAGMTCRQRRLTPSSARTPLGGRIDGFDVGGPAPALTMGVRSAQQNHECRRAHGPAITSRTSASIPSRFAPTKAWSSPGHPTPMTEIPKVVRARSGSRPQRRHDRASRGSNVRRPRGIAAGAGTVPLCEDEGGAVAGLGSGRPGRGFEDEAEALHAESPRPRVRRGARLRTDHEGGLDGPPTAGRGSAKPSAASSSSPVPTRKPGRTRARRFRSPTNPANGTSAATAPAVPSRNSPPAPGAAATCSPTSPSSPDCRQSPKRCAWRSNAVPAGPRPRRPTRKEAG